MFFVHASGRAVCTTIRKTEDEHAVRAVLNSLSLLYMRVWGSGSRGMTLLGSRSIQSACPTAIPYLRPFVNIPLSSEQEPMEETARAPGAYSAGGAT